MSGRLSIRLALVVFAVGCGRDVTTPGYENPSDNTVEPIPTDPALTEGGRPRLPPLPPDLTSPFGALARSVRERHEQALPTMEKAFATTQEHQAWVDTVLQPWLDAGTPIGIEINATRPAFPDPDATEDAMGAYARAHFVHGALSATHMVDASIVRVNIRIPASAREDESARAFLVSTARTARQDLALSRSLCTYAGGDTAPPPDLESWQRYCDEITAHVLTQICAAEARLQPPAVGEGCTAQN